MRNFVYSLFVVILFVCTAFTGVSGQQSGFSFNVNLWPYLQAGHQSSIGTIGIEPDDTMQTMTVGLQFAAGQGQVHSGDIMPTCWMWANVDIIDIWGSPRGHTTISGPLTSGPIWSGMNIKRNEVVEFSNITIDCPCYEATLNNWGLNGESINMQVVTEGFRGNTFYADTYNKGLTFNHPTDTVAFFSMGNTTYDNQSNSVRIDYYLDPHGQNTYEWFAEVISTTSWQAYTTYSMTNINSGPGTISLNMSMNSWPTFQPSNGIYIVRYGIKSQETCQEIYITETFEISGIVGVADPLGTSVSVYPNPASIGTPVTLSISGGEAIDQIQIWDMQGRKIMDIQPNAVGTGDYQIETTGMTKGTYLVRYPQGESYITKKLVIR